MLCTSILVDRLLFSLYVCASQAQMIRNTLCLPTWRTNPPVVFLRVVVDSRVQIIVCICLLHFVLSWYAFGMHPQP